MSFKYVNITKHKASVPEQRRDKFLKGLRHQLLVLEKFDPNQTVKGSWIWMDDGKYIISPVYGRKPLNLSKGKNAIQCTDPDECKSTIEQLIEMTLKGEIDQCLNEAASSIRNSFRKSGG